MKKAEEYIQKNLNFYPLIFHQKKSLTIGLNIIKNIGELNTMIVVDVETTGIDPKKHAILSIGAVEFENPENQFYGECRIWEGAEIMEAEGDLKSALEINGFTREEIRDPKKNSQKQLMKKFLKYIQSCKEHTFAGENPSFDRDFLAATGKREKLPWTLVHRTIDVHTLGYIYFLKKNCTPPQKNKRTDLKLDNILTLVGLSEEPKPHHALTGAKMEAEAISRLLFGKPLLKEFSTYPMPKGIEHGN